MLKANMLKTSKIFVALKTAFMYTFLLFYYHLHDI